MGAGLPIIEFAFPGPLRDALIAAIKSGTKTSTSSLMREYNVSGDPLPFVGHKGIAINSNGERLFVIETTGVEIVQMRDVPLARVLAEGEGYLSKAEWHAAHMHFWSSTEMRTELGPDFGVNDDSLVVLERFAVVR